MDLISSTNATLTSISKILDYFKNNVAGHFTDTSLTSITKLTRAEPLTIISKDCSTLDYLPRVLDSVCNIYSGYFLQAVAILTRVNDVEVVRILDRLNPDRDETGFLLQGRYATESSHTLFKDNYKFSLPTRETIALESRAIDMISNNNKNQATIYETANLAVGKLLNVSITVSNEEGVDKTISIPVSVRLSPAILSDETLTYLFTSRKIDTDIVERYHSWRSGRIALISDMIFCQDLIKEYRRAMMKDRTGVLAEIARRANNARSFGLLTKNPSLSVASNIYVISKETASLIEAKTGQKFSNPKGREKILENTYAMLIGIIDPDWEQVTFYFNGIAAPSTIKISAMKSGKDKGPDIADVMKTLLDGRAPTF